MSRLRTLDGPRLAPVSGRATALVVLLHGYGANGEDLLGLAHGWRSRLPDAAFVAPNAPDAVPGMPGALQWFPLTLQDPSEYWRGVVAAAPGLDRFIAQELARLGVAAGRLALVGFSQGSMLALHVALRRAVAPVAVVAYSGLLAGPEHLGRSKPGRPFCSCTVRPTILLRWRPCIWRASSWRLPASRSSGTCGPALRTASMPRAAPGWRLHCTSLQGLRRGASLCVFCLSFQSAADAFTGPTCTASMAPLIKPGVLSSSQGYGREIGAVNAYTAAPENFPALVLNADFRPLSYYPLSLWSWQESVKAVFLERVNIVSEYDRFVRSPSFEMRLPSVVSLKTYVKPALYPAFTRFNVFLRDRFACQYCGDKDDLTFDHLDPALARGTDPLGQRRHCLRPVQFEQGRAFRPPRRHAASADAVSADGVRTAPKRAFVPAQLPARELARLPLLGHRTGTVSRFRLPQAAALRCCWLTHKASAIRLTEVFQSGVVVAGAKLKALSASLALPPSRKMRAQARRA